MTHVQNKSKCLHNNIKATQSILANAQNVQTTAIRNLHWRSIYDHTCVTYLSVRIIKAMYTVISLHGSYAVSSILTLGLICSYVSVMRFYQILKLI